MVVAKEDDQGVGPSGSPFGISMIIATTIFALVFTKTTTRPCNTLGVKHVFGIGIARAQA